MGDFQGTGVRSVDAHGGGFGPGTGSFGTDGADADGEPSLTGSDVVDGGAEPILAGGDEGPPGLGAGAFGRTSGRRIPNCHPNGGSTAGGCPGIFRMRGRGGLNARRC